MKKDAKNNAKKLIKIVKIDTKKLEAVTGGGAFCCVSGPASRSFACTEQ